MKGYADTMEYLYGLEKFGIVFGLENIEWILDRLDNPQGRMKTIHIAGTNGKGSTASMLSRMLQEEGYRVGKYTSPHLLSFTERITINEERITEEEVVAVADNIRERTREGGEDRFFTFFDFTTALAFEYFFEKGTDISVIETGLGGRLDSTNVVRPVVSVITNVEYDHMDYLGNEITDIAREKAGIIKDGVPLVTGARGPALRVIEAAAEERSSAVYALGRDFTYERVGDQHMTYKGLGKTLDNVFVNLMGDHQLTNGAVALSAAQCVAAAGFPLSEGSMRDGLTHVEWQGRLEIVKEKPLVLMDGAHNPSGARALADYIGSHHGRRKKILVFGVMKDKDYPAILREILPLFDLVIMTRPNMERALSPHRLGDYSKGAIIKENMADALAEARDLARDEDLVVITGSIFAIGEAKAVIGDIF